MILLTGWARSTTGNKKRAVQRWNRTTGVPVVRRLDRLLNKFDWEMQIKFGHISDITLLSWEGLDQMLQLLDTLCGEREGDGLRRAA